jgi:catechol 2,3-dioxygenase-like lactoylglutathione lyase family enzyme
VDHLALKVSDQERSRRFYETYCGFGARPPRRYEDDTLMLYDDDGFALALGVQPFEPHFGVSLPDAELVGAVAERLEADGVEIVERWAEPEYASVKARDPDGHVVEFWWEPT